MNATKIQLSSQELTLLQDADFILTKNAILQKVHDLLATVVEKEQAYIADNKLQMPESVLRSSPKISRGENYRGLPWLVADYPRVFEKGHTLAIRQLCWWGQHFSSTLHISGKYLDEMRESLINNIAWLKDDQWWICNSDDEWQHHFEAGYYLPMADYTEKSIAEQIQSRSFIKIAHQWPLAQWPLAQTAYFENFKALCEILKN